VFNNPYCQAGKILLYDKNNHNFSKKTHNKKAIVKRAAKS